VSADAVLPIDGAPVHPGVSAAERQLARFLPPGSDAA
jgi:hypothetical protein